MSGGWIHVIWVLCVIAWICFVRRRSRRDFAEILAPVLLKHGFNLLSLRVPAKGDTGPFPQPSGTASHPAAYLAVGSPWQFRVVRFSSSGGKEHEVWVRMFLKGNQVDQIDWHPDLTSINAEADQHARQASLEDAPSESGDEPSALAFCHRCESDAR